MTTRREAGLSFATYFIAVDRPPIWTDKNHGSDFGHNNIVILYLVKFYIALHVLRTDDTDLLFSQVIRQR